MAHLNDQRLTLLDPTNAHQHYERTLDRRIFIRFHENDPCVSHVNARSQTSRSDVHFFLPDDRTDLIATPAPFYNNIMYHIYCRDIHLEQSIKDEFSVQALGRVFTNNNLSFRLQQAAALILFELSQNTPNQLNAHEYRTATSRQLHDLAAELERHREAQPNRHPVEIQ